MKSQNEERQHLEQALGRMEKHLLTRLERTFNVKNPSTIPAPTGHQNSLFQRFFNRPG